MRKRPAWGAASVGSGEPPRDDRPRRSARREEERRRRTIRRLTVAAACIAVAFALWVWLFPVIDRYVNNPQIGQ